MDRCRFDHRIGPGLALQERSTSSLYELLELKVLLLEEGELLLLLSSPYSLLEEELVIHWEKRFIYY